MKILFDNDEQRSNVIRSFCVDELYVDREEVCCEDCESCWERHIETEVEEDE